MMNPTLLLIASMALLSQAAAAQPTGSTSDAATSRTAAYSFVEPGEIPVSILVLGHVRSPGQYWVGIGTPPDRLIALAGGPLVSPTDERTVTSVVVRLLRPDGGGVRRQVFERPLDSVLASPGGALDDGDVLDVTVVVQPPPRRRLDTVLRVITTAGTLFLVIYNVVSR